jgi:hypothetical protein
VLVAANCPPLLAADGFPGVAGPPNCEAAGAGPEVEHGQQNRKRGNHVIPARAPLRRI